MSFFSKLSLVSAVVVLLIGLKLSDLNTFNLCGKCSTIAGVVSNYINKVFESKKANAVIEECNQVWITVFVHGIMGIRPHLSIGNMIRFMQDNVHGTEYAKAVEIMRKDSTFYQHQAMGELGFHKIDMQKIDKGYASGAMAYLIDMLTKNVYCEQDIMNIFYTYGWSGITTESARHQAGRELYHLLTQEVLTFKKRGITPKIRIIGYSHGGNVALNLGAVRDYKQHPFIVDELVLLGTPIQVETDHLIQSSLFKYVYHLFSPGDRVQRMDCFSNKRFFSKKVFESRSDFELPTKLRQIELRVTDVIRTRKTDCIERSLNKKAITKAFITGKARFLRDRSPGHAELWFFGWTPQGYRAVYPLYPLPTIALIPFIIKYVEDFISQYQITKEPIVVDFRAAYAKAIVRLQNQFEKYMVRDFLSQADLTDLHNDIQAYVPIGYTQELYNRQVYHACQQAKQFMQHNDKEMINTIKL